MPRKSSLCSRFILIYNNHRLKPHSQVGVIFLVPLYSLNILLSQQESGDKRLPFFSVACLIFTPPASNERALSAL